jgi:DUF4097 and DUF4098 domain-containing protein YvlB
VTAARPERAVALALGGLLALVFGATASFHVASWTLGTASRTQHRVIPGATSVGVVADGHVDVEVETGSAGAVTVDSVAHGSLRAPHLNVSVDGDTVHVAGGCGPVWFGHCSATVTVRVPPGGSARVRSHEGDVRASGLSGPVRLVTGSGDVDADNLTGSADLHTSSGDITAHDLSGPARLETGSGDVAAEGLSGPGARASTGSGDVTMLFSSAPASASADTGTGDINLLVPRGFAYRVQAETTFGDRVVEVDTSGTRHRLQAHTGSGDVVVGYSS